MLAWKYQLSRTDLHVHRLCLLLLAILAIGVLTACSERKATLQFKSTDITGTTIGGDFAMTDHTGQPRKLSDYKGKIVLLFFGFTHCPDVCPTTLSEAAGAMKVLGERSKDVQVLFVTVDPERDTQALLAQYVPAFDPRFVALRGFQLLAGAGEQALALAAHRHRRRRHRRRRAVRAHPRARRGGLADHPE